MKFDGFRGTLYIEEGRAFFRSKAMRVMTRFQQLADALARTLDVQDAIFPGNRHDREASERFHAFTYEDLIKRDKVNLDIFWLKEESLEESANLPAPEIIAQEIADDLQAALEQFPAIAEDLG